MSNLPPNPYNIPGAPPTNANPGPPIFSNNPVPMNQLPPSYPGLKQDSNSNSPAHGVQNSGIHNVNHLNQSSSSSPAFNHPGMMPPPHPGPESSPVRPPLKPLMAPSPNMQQPFNSASPRTVPNANPSPTPYLNNFPPQQRQINDNAPPLIPSSQSNQPLKNGPPASQTPSQYPTSSSSFSPVPPNMTPSSSGLPPINPAYGPPLAKPPGPGQVNQPNVSMPGPQFSGPLRNSPLIPGPTNGPSSISDYRMPPVSGPPLGPPRPAGVNGTHFTPPTSGSKVGPGSNYQSDAMSSVSGPSMVPPSSGAPIQSYPGPQRNGPSGPGQPMNTSGPMPPLNSFGGQQNLPPRYQATGPQSLPPMGQMNTPSGPLGPLNGPPKGPIGLQSGPATPPNVSMGLASGPMSPPSGYMGQPSGHMPPHSASMGAMPPPNRTMLPQSGPQGLSSGPQMPTRPPGHLNGPPGQPSSLPPGPPSSLPPGPSMGNMQNRYPPMPQGNFPNQQPMPQNMGKQYAQYPNQGLTQQMGQLSVTKQGFDQLWGHHMVDLLQCRHILPEYPEDPPEIKLGHQFADAPNCSPDIFRCTINRIPDTNSLLQKSRLPLGILIHPFKDLNHLPVIQCSTIVRCRACRTYINPFVYFVDSKRWKCNLCYRVNDLPEEFQYDPVSKSYGDPSRRPEIKSATIEFIAPGEYMLRPPQPAVYLFLFDVSQIARESGYLQVVCDTLKSYLDELPGDARTQVGFICFDAHIHYYLMGEGLTRPKEMTVLDIDDVFLPSPESLVVNRDERRELVRELLAVLPQRHAAPGAPHAAAASSACALGAALQAAYKLMAPTGGRITVFQTCLPNVGPGALQPREDPNARSSKEVAHLNPATDFYKRLALDCSGAQVAVDLFLLNSQYSDLATLSGMSKFSAGTVYHIPLFLASRPWQAEKLRRSLTRYLTRKIGFEAVMRVRCTRGISIHTFHGNFFVRSTDLLSLPNVSPDAGFGMQLSIDEALSDLQQVCFQAALLYTSSKGERRIRVHTLALPIASNLTDVLHAADQQCIIGLLSKMAVDRCASASMSEAREALTTVAVDALSAHRLAQNLPAGAASAALHAPASLALLPLYLLALLKRKAFRTGTSTRLDDRVADMCDMKTLPLYMLLRAVYPDLYPVHALGDHGARDDDDTAPDPPRMQLSAERINSNGAYLLDDGETMIIYVCHAVSPAFLSDTFGVAAFSQLHDESRTLPKIESEGNALLHAFIDKLNDDRPYASNILILKDNSPSRQVFTERLVEDRVESAFSYYEFLQHVKSQVK
ncbi:protein transport protein Sec24A [Amyelois transitella]|uniref:protein transport protein Sec24A n=1 Tax=Amyelois transitella TaxID=680683 RepID=UPI0029900286|nr:protein transport protein Sec24A [Amyelois transitella]